MSTLLSIVIPVYNEERRIIPSLGRIIEFLNTKRFKSEIILVDDGSKDGSVKIISEFIKANAITYPLIKFILLPNEKNQGKGFVVRQGIMQSSGDFVLFSDADLSAPIEEFDKLFEFCKLGFPVVIGSRSLPDSEVLIRQHIFRQQMGRGFNLFVKLFTPLRFIDTQCGFKLFDRKAVDRIFPQLVINDFSFDVEILLVAYLLGIKVKEVPVKWLNSPQSKVNVLRDPIKMILSLVKLNKLHPK